MPKNNSAPKTATPAPQFGDRLKFCIWLSAKTLGVESAKQLSAVLGKRQGQLSSWLKEEPKPGWSNIKHIADAIGVNARWLDDPGGRDAVEPEEWAAWWEARARFLAASSEREKGAGRNARGRGK